MKKKIKKKKKGKKKKKKRKKKKIENLKGKLTGESEGGK